MSATLQILITMRIVKRNRVFEGWLEEPGLKGCISCGVEEKKEMEFGEEKKNMNKGQNQEGVLCVPTDLCLTRVPK